MPSRNLHTPGWSRNDGYADREDRLAKVVRRLSLLTGQFMVVAILIAGSAIVFSGALSESVEPADRVVLKGHSQLVEAVAFSPDGRTLASCGWDNSVHLWDVSRMNGPDVAPVVLRHDSVRFAVAFSADGKLLAAAGHNSLTIWSCESGQFTPCVEKEGETFRCLAFSPDGRTLALGSADGSIRLWDGRTGDERAVLREHRDMVRSVAFSPDGRFLVSSGQDRLILLWDARRGVSIRPLGFPGINPVQIVAFSPDGKSVAVGEIGDNPQDVLLLNPETGEIRTRLTGHSHGITALAFSPDGHALATAGIDRCIKLWNVADGTERATLSNGVGPVKSLAFSVNGAWLAFAGSDYTVRIWDVARGRPDLVVRTPLKISQRRREPHRHDARLVHPFGYIVDAPRSLPTQHA